MKYKAIRSAVHNFGHSFTSTLNYVGDDHVMTHLLRAAVRLGKNQLRVNLLSGTVEPDGFVNSDVRQSIDAYVRWFPQHLSAHRVEAKAIVRADMSIMFDPTRRAVVQGYE